MAAPTSPCDVKILLANSEPSTHGLFVPDAGLCLLGRLNHGQLADHEIEIAPSQGRDLSTPQAAEDRQDRPDEYALTSHGLDQFGSLAEIVRVHGGMDDLRWIDGGGRVANQHFSLHSLG